MNFWEKLFNPVQLSDFYNPFSVALEAAYPGTPNFVYYFFQQCFYCRSGCGKPSEAFSAQVLEYLLCSPIWLIIWLGRNSKWKVLLFCYLQNTIVPAFCIHYYSLLWWSLSDPFSFVGDPFLLFVNFYYFLLMSLILSILIIMNLAVNFSLSLQFSNLGVT